MNNYHTGFTHKIVWIADDVFSPLQLTFSIILFARQTQKPQKLHNRVWMPRLAVSFLLFSLQSMLVLVRKLNWKLIEHNAVDENQKLIDCDAAGPRERAGTWTGSQNNMQCWRNRIGLLRKLFFHSSSRIWIKGFWDFLPVLFLIFAYKQNIESLKEAFTGFSYQHSKYSIRYDYRFLSAFFCSLFRKP